MIGFSDLRCVMVLRIISSVLMVASGITSAADEVSPRIATVNKLTIHQRDVELELLVSGTKSPTPADREAALERVIDRVLVAHSIATKGTDPLTDDVEELVQYVRRGIESGGDNVEVVLGKLKLTEADVRHAAQAAVSWKAFVLRTVTESQIREHFEQHREQFDGTQVRMRQIVRTITAPGTTADWDDATKLLTDLRLQIESNKIDFAAAALAHSQSPTSKSGGDVGFIRFQGDVPAPVAATAFTLKIGETSPPIRSSVGVHLIQVTERKPGDLSLEDARPAVLRELGVQLWDTTVKTLRAKAKIVRE